MLFLIINLKKKVKNVKGPADRGGETRVVEGAVGTKNPR